MTRSRSNADAAIDHLLGELEAAIMRQMWRRSPATVREVLEALNAQGRSLAYTTVLTVMSRLHQKGLLVRDLAGKTHVYRVAMTTDQFLQQVAAQRVHALLAEFGDLAISHFLAEIEDLSPERRRQIERLARGDEP